MRAFRADGPAVGRLDGEDVRRGVAPGPAAGELDDRHDLDGVDPQLPQVVELLDGRLEGAGLPVLPPLVVERADVQLVDDQLVARGHAELVGPQSKAGRVVDHAVARRVGDLAGVGVDPRELAAGRLQQVAVLVPGPGPGDLGVPAAVPLGLHRVAAAVPAVEGADDGDPLRVRRPDPERGLLPVGHRPHPDRPRTRVRHRLASPSIVRPGCAARSSRRPRADPRPGSDRSPPSADDPPSICPG